MSEMPEYDQILRILGVVVVACPLLLTIALGLPSLMGWKCPSRWP